MILVNGLLKAKRTGGIRFPIMYSAFLPSSMPMNFWSFVGLLTVDSFGYLSFDSGYGNAMPWETFGHEQFWYLNNILINFLGVSKHFWNEAASYVQMVIDMNRRNKNIDYSHFASMDDTYIQLHISG